MREFKYCAYCGAKIGANAKFCGQCGMPQPSAETAPIEDNTVRPVSVSAPDEAHSDANENAPSEAPIQMLLDIDSAEAMPSADELMRAAGKHADADANAPRTQSAEPANAEREGAHEAPSQPSVQRAGAQNARVNEALPDRSTVKAASTLKTRDARADTAHMNKPDAGADQLNVPKAHKGVPAGAVAVIVAGALAAGLLGGRALSHKDSAPNSTVGVTPGAMITGAPIAVETNAPTAAEQTAVSETEAPAAQLNFVQKYAQSVDPSLITTLTIDCAGDGTFYEESVFPAYADRGQTLDMDDLAQFVNLESLNVCNSSSVIMPSSATLTKLKTLSFNNSSLKDNLSGIQNCAALERLALNDTDLNDLSSIAGTNIQILMLARNGVTNLYPLENMASLQVFEERGENIWDFRGLRNVPYVEIARTDDGENAFGIDHIGHMERDPAARQVQVLASVLNIRTAPNSTTDATKTGEHAVQGAYYYILDEYWDDATGTTWYKIGSWGDGYWIAAKEGDWTRLCE